MLENRSSHWRNLSQAFIAGIDGTPLDGVMPPFRFAFSAVRHTVGESLFAKVLKARLIVRKLTVEVIDCVP